jgi:hypothetical protein
MPLVKLPGSLGLSGYIANSIKSVYVINLFEQFFETYAMPKQIIVRNDNESHGGNLTL